MAWPLLEHLWKLTAFLELKYLGRDCRQHKAEYLIQVHLIWFYFNLLHIYSSNPAFCSSWKTNERNLSGKKLLKLTRPLKFRNIILFFTIFLPKCCSLMACLRNDCILIPGGFLAAKPLEMLFVLYFHLGVFTHLTFSKKCWIVTKAHPSFLRFSDKWLVWKFNYQPLWTLSTDATNNRVKKTKKIVPSVHTRQNYVMFLQFLFFFLLQVEVKPYVLDDQMCDECQGTRCGGKFAPFFCANVTCLQYYCEYCWASIHSRAGREFHKPLVKEGGDRPRHVPFRWSWTPGLTQQQVLE